MFRDRTNLYISYRQSFAHHPSKKPHSAIRQQRRRLSRSRRGRGRRGGGGGGTNDDERRGLMSSADDEDDDDDEYTYDSDEAAAAVASGTNSGGAAGGSPGDAVIEMSMLPPRWTAEQDEVTALLADAAVKSARLDKLHAQHLLPGFGDEAARAADERRIEQLTQEITRAFHECQRCVRRIEVLARDDSKVGGAVGAEMMARNVQVSLAGRVQEASATFRKKQSKYLKKLREIDGLDAPLERAYNTGPGQTPYTDPSLLESEADVSFSQSTLQQTHQRRTTAGGVDDATIRQREREIDDIARGILELSDIFRDLQAMVIDQGTMLDRIDYNVENMKIHVKGADKELVVATNWQRRTVKRKILLLLALLIVGLIVLLVIKPKKTAARPPPPSPRMLPRSSRPSWPRPPASRRLLMLGDVWSDLDPGLRVRGRGIGIEIGGGGVG